MFLLSEPTIPVIHAWLDTQQSKGFTYESVGATRTETPPADFQTDRREHILGTGRPCFEQACAGLRSWIMYPASWTKIHYPASALEVGVTYAILVQHLGFWSMNSARIIYTIDESNDEQAQFGFGLGTLEGHAECGEERFLVSWSASDNQVTYSIYAFSRPRHPLAKLGYPITRYLQKRFARDSCQAMFSYTQNPPTPKLAYRAFPSPRQSPRRRTALRPFTTASTQPSR
jgi:uncharacterized protein (UPF0548 family)